jgi:hypothetical protein
MGSDGWAAKATPSIQTHHPTANYVKQASYKSLRKPAKEEVVKRTNTPLKYDKIVSLGDGFAESIIILVGIACVAKKIYQSNHLNFFLVFFSCPRLPRCNSNILRK